MPRIVKHGITNALPEHIKNRKTKHSFFRLRGLTALKRALHHLFRGKSSQTPSVRTHERKATPLPGLPPPTSQFQFIKTIGTGNFGKVCEIREFGTDRRLAAKFASADASRQAALHAEIQNELDIMGILSKPGHPNLTTLQGTLSENNVTYLLMDLGGPSLSSHLAAGKQFTPAQVASLMKQLISGIGYMRSHAIQHNDIRADNLLYDGKVLKICDFGRATKMGILQPTVVLNYMPPEVLSECRSNNLDMWSAACLMVELLLGEQLITRQQLNVNDNNHTPLSRGDRNQMIRRQIAKAAQRIEACAGKDAALLFRGMTRPMKSRITPEEALKSPFLAQRPATAV